MREKVALLVNNLAILGISKFAQSQLDINISTRTFTALENHKKAGEVIWYCLLQALDPEECSQRLKSSFPCTDGRKSRDFRNAVFKWLNELKKSTKILGPSVVRRSLLDGCAGERYEDLLFQLSTHVYLSNLANCNLQSSILSSSDVLVSDEAASLVELQVHDLVQTYRLCKLRGARHDQMHRYKSFNDVLTQKEKQLSHASKMDVKAISIEVVSQTVQEQIARIKSRTSRSALWDIIDPPPLNVEEFFLTLPWSRPEAAIQTTKGVRDLNMERHELERRIAEIRASIPAVTTATSPSPSKTIRRDNLTKSEIVLSEVPPIQFRKPRFEQLEKIWRDELSILEPDYTLDVPMTDDIERVRRLTSTKHQHTSHLPRPVTKREIVRVQENLQRTALTNRVKVFQQPPSPFDEPMTPKRATSAIATSTAKSINRLINLLNDSDNEVLSTSSPALSRQSQTPVPYRGTNRSLEQSFTLWQPYD
ncbi:Putative uncharacterized protein [Taphrina deformans PYCC 5710]|uniref:HAUS augmin-like complex subunit 6 N-terminal domain-containing protein n=1 Tax=Taphrina deformans (strain PYCC 5710 / ATCC 11124 / CBS 356.35 / IMI 108563 / JCM 9778 / NBRC 8474) TaxID=1097556 RepID=R4XC80_TAPDE|nr:Putative uncharacterized protein [Taphrina deformans PYCC 5710]|eukprot:CCG80940.1 Putative uncharacterized protein [Taphrina deformans PYCC 5710]